MKPRGLTHVSRTVAEELGIDLSSRKEGELFKRLLVCLLFFKPIQQEIAESAYTRLVSDLRGPDAVLSAGLDKSAQQILGVISAVDSRDHEEPRRNASTAAVGESPT